VLAAAGAALTDVVRVGIVMRALQRDRPAFNQVWAARFGAHRPARSAIEAADFGRPGEGARFHARGDRPPWLTGDPPAVVPRPSWGTSSAPTAADGDPDHVPVHRSAPHAVHRAADRPG
jgi:hypothetical protein